MSALSTVADRLRLRSACPDLDIQTELHYLRALHEDSHD